MRQYLETFWLNTKEIEVYVYLSNYGVSPASEIAKNLGLPKSSINFLADNLWKRGILKKSCRWKTWYYEIDVGMFEETFTQELSNKQQALQKILPILKEKNKNSISKPKILFIDWVDQCKKYYQQLLNYEIFYEFGAHSDLVEAFWEEFMNNFMDQRVKRNVFCDSIWSDWERERQLQKLDTKHFRKLKIFPEALFWEINSSISVFDNKVLILNLKGISTGVLIENRELSETMKTIFMIAKREW